MKIKVNDKDFVFFNNFTVKRSLNSIASSFAFIGKFNPENPDHVKLFKPLSYPDIKIFTNDDKLLLTGTIIVHEFNSKAAPELVKLSGYSSGGVLEDCNIPFSSYPLESNNRSLKEIAEKILNVFKLKLIINTTVSKEANLIYEKSVAGPTDTIKGYLSKLAAQRNIVLSHDEKGNIILFRPDVNKLPVLSLNTTNTDGMSMSVSGQSFHSEITVLRQPSDSNNNLTPADKVNNPLVKAFRPKVKTLSSGTDTDTSKSAKNELATELQGIKIKINIPRFEDVKPGDLVEVVNSEIYISKKTKFIIEAVDISENSKETRTSLTVVLPESFTGEQPIDIFNI